MFDLFLEYIPPLTMRNVIIGVLAFLATFFINLAIVSLILVKIPANHFSRTDKKKFGSGSHPTVRVPMVVGKNILGGFLVALGIVLSLPGVPGQGLLTVLLGLMLLDFPGKQRLEQKLLSRPAIVNAINGLRRRFGKQPLELN